MGREQVGKWKGWEEEGGRRDCNQDIVYERRRKAKQAMMSKSVSSPPPWPPGSYLELS